MPKKDEQKTVLIMTSAIGGGHVFRDLAIAKALRAEVPELRLVFASAGAAHDMIARQGECVERIAPLEVPAADGHAHFTTLYLRLLWSELRQHFDLHRLLKTHRPSVVVLDEFFFLADYCAMRKIPVAFICDFVGVPRSPFWSKPLASTLETFFDWFLMSWLPRRTERWIFASDELHVPHESWRRRAKERGVCTVGPITRLNYQPAPSREEARLRLGLDPHTPLITVTVGCSGTGGHLLDCANQAATRLCHDLPGVRIELVCGYGIDTAALEQRAHPSVTVHGYVDDLEAYYAASDVVVAQAGFTTTAECVGVGTPLVAVPLGGHWEQENTARYLAESGLAVCLTSSGLSPDRLVDAIRQARSQSPRSRPLADGHVLAAREIAALLA